MRIELTFKKNEKDLYDYLKEQGKYITVSGYLKQLIAIDRESKINGGKLNEKK